MIHPAFSHAALILHLTESVQSVMEIRETLNTSPSSFPLNFATESATGCASSDA